MKSPVVMGIDPSIAKTGVVILRGTDLLHAQTLKTPPGRTDEERVMELALLVNNLANAYGVEAAGIEKQHAGGCRGNSLVKLCLAAGALLGGLANRDFPVYGVQPTAARKALGYGAMKKPQVQEATRRRLNMEKKLPQDQADACAVALAADARHRIELAKGAD